MNTDNYMLSFIALLAFVFLGRMISEKANKKLGVEKKAELIDLFSRSRMFSAGVLIFILSVYVVVMKFNLLAVNWAIGLYAGMLLVFIVWNAIWSQKKLKAHDFPQDFIRSYLLSTSVRFVGILIFFGLVMR